jgi:hypothetical protein
LTVLSNSGQFEQLPKVAIRSLSAVEEAVQHLVDRLPILSPHQQWLEPRNNWQSDCESALDGSREDPEIVEA